MANPEREIKDMDERMAELREVISELDGVVRSEHIKKMEGVVDEWEEYTKGCIEELVEKIEEHEE